MKSLDDMTEVELKALFHKIANRLKRMLPPETGFMLVAAPMNTPRSIAQYVGNVQRRDAAAWMVETLERWAANDFVPRVGS